MAVTGATTVGAFDWQADRRTVRRSMPVNITIGARLDLRNLICSSEENNSVGKAACALRTVSF